MKTKYLALTIFTFLLVFACQTDSEDILIEDSASKEIPVKDPIYMDIGNTVRTYTAKHEGDGLLKSSETRSLALYMAEYITAEDSKEIGNIVYFMNVGNKQLGADFVPNDNSFADGSNDISYYVDKKNPTDDVSELLTTEAINNAMNTWDGVTCSDFGLFEVPFNPAYSTGVTSNTANGIFADVTHVGWFPTAFFDWLTPGGSTFILGVTFTYIFVDDNGDPVDTDKNKKEDVALREIYYNDTFEWSVDGSRYDVESIALHEAGHGLSQAHFGKAFRTVEGGKVHFAPRALMNAGYSGIQTSIEKTDKAGHCSNWAQWPNK